MGGRISVDSQEGEGSCFQISLPLTSGTSNTSGDTDVALLKPYRILLVDHSAAFLSVMQRQAEHCGLTLLTARTSQQALEWSRQAPDDANTLLLANNWLADGDGLTLFRLLQEQNLLRQGHHLLMTPIRPRPDAEELKAAGVDHVIQKPVMWKQLREALLNLHHGVLDSVSRPHLPTPSPGARRRILVAEDNQVNQLVVSKMLEKLGMDYELADNGRQALNMLLRDYDRYDAVLMDCEMPVLDGYEATRLLRQQEIKLQQHHKPVIALTAHVLAEHKRKAEQVGMDDFLCKPLEYRALEDKLRTLFEFYDQQARNQGTA